MDLSVKDIPRDIRIIDMTYMYFISPTQRNTLAEHKMFIFRSIIQKFKSTVRHFHLSLIVVHVACPHFASPQFCREGPKTNDVIHYHVHIYSIRKYNIFTCQDAGWVILCCILTVAECNVLNVFNKTWPVYKAGGPEALSLHLTMCHRISPWSTNSQIWVLDYDN